MQASDTLGEKYGIGHSVVPCVIEAVIASTMPKQWNMGTWIIMPVGGGKIHTVADAFAVVDDIVVRQHDTLGESGCAGGVLHVADVVFVDGCGAAVYLLIRGCFAASSLRFVPGETALLFCSRRL